MRDLKAHFALFVVAVVATLLTWNRGPAGRSAADVAPAWEYDSTDFRWFRYGNPALDLRIERREDAGGPFYWGVQIHKDRSPEPLQFPVGASGAALIPTPRRSARAAPPGCAVSRAADAFRACGLR